MLTSSTPDALWNTRALRALQPAAVACVNLRFGRHLDRCSLTVPVGARLLIVSDPAGAASTLLRVLAGLSRPAAGEIRIAGSTDPSATGWGRRVAYLGPMQGFYTSMTPNESLRLAGRLQGLTRDDVAHSSERAAAWAQIPSEARDRPLAGGGAELLERTALAAALVGDPEVLLLDEPLRAIEAWERERLLRLPGRRRTVLLASRYPGTERALVSHVAYLRGGRVEFVSAIAALEARGLSLSHGGLAAFADAGPAEREAMPG